jgi:hypothetical protein
VTGNLDTLDASNVAVEVPEVAAEQALGDPGSADQQHAGWVRRYSVRLVLADLAGLLVSAQILLIAGYPAIRTGGASIEVNCRLW